jgi:hypothetical protein
MPEATLELTRAQILAFRRCVGALDERLPAGARSLRGAAWAGLQDSMPRAALLLQGAGRELRSPMPGGAELWTSRVWPGAVLVGGELVGTWRRTNEKLSIRLWRRLTRTERDAVAAEAQSLPLPGIEGRISVRWVG